jgi:hypothetical protein
MLVVRGRLENRQAIINIGVQRFDLSSAQSLSEQSPIALQIASYRALIDTGAQRTCLTNHTIAKEKLSRHGKKFIKNVRDEHMHSLFMVKIGFWCEDEQILDAQQLNKSFYGLDRPTEVINISDNNLFDAIIGMDVLKFFDFRFYKNGDFVISLA